MIESIEYLIFIGGYLVFCTVGSELDKSFEVALYCDSHTIKVRWSIPLLNAIAHTGSNIMPRVSKPNPFSSSSNLRRHRPSGRGQAKGIRKVSGHGAQDSFDAGSPKPNANLGSSTLEQSSTSSNSTNRSGFVHDLFGLAAKLRKPIGLVALGILRIPLFATPAQSPLAETYTPPDGFSSGSFAYEDSSGNSNHKPLADGKTDIIVPAPNPHPVNVGLDVPNRIPNERDPVIVPDRLPLPIIPVFPNPPKVDEIETRPDSTPLRTNRPVMIVPTR